MQQQNGPKKGAGGREAANRTPSADLGRETQQHSDFREMNSQKEKPIPRNVIATLNRGHSVQNPELEKLNGACRTGKAAAPKVVEKVKSGIRTKNQSFSKCLQRTAPENRVAVVQPQRTVLLLREPCGCPVTAADNSEFG